MVWEERKLGWRVPTAAATIYQKPNPLPYYDFMSFVRTQPEFIRQYYSCIRFLDQVISRGELGDEVDESEALGVLRLYECLQDEAF